jgi:hypothetical protein
MFENIGKGAADSIAAALPGVEKTVADAVAGVNLIVQQALLPALAEVVATFEMQCDRLDGATITVEPSAPLTVTITIPTFTLRVNMPLKPTA